MYTLMQTCVATTEIKNGNVSVIPESSAVPLSRQSARTEALPDRFLSLQMRSPLPELHQLGPRNIPC